MSVWHFWRRNRASLVPQHKESACNAGAAVDTDPVHVAPRLPCSWAFPGKSTRGACHFLLQEISPTRGGNTGLLHCRHILSQLSHQENHELLYLPSVGEENGSPLQYSCLGNPMDRGARQATTVHNNWFQKWAQEPVRVWVLHGRNTDTEEKGKAFSIGSLCPSLQAAIVHSAGEIESARQKIREKHGQVGTRASRSPVQTHLFLKCKELWKVVFPSGWKH